MSIIQVHKLYKSFGDVEALNEIDLEVQDSEIFGLIGPDGAGKTTLFRILTTLLIPDSGTANVCGYDVVKEYKDLLDKAEKIKKELPENFRDAYFQLVLQALL